MYNLFTRVYQLKLIPPTGLDTNEILYIFNVSSTKYKCLKIW